MCKKVLLNDKDYLRANQVPYFNHWFYAYKKRYKFYGYLEFHSSINAFAFKLSEIDLITVFDDDTINYKFEPNYEHLIKHLNSVLRKAGISFLDIGFWLGLDDKIKPFIFNTSDPFEYDHIPFKRRFFEKKPSALFNWIPQYKSHI